MTERLYKKSEYEKSQDLRNAFYFDFVLLCFDIYCAFIYNVYIHYSFCRFSRGNGEYPGANKELTLKAGIPRPWVEARQIWLTEELQVPSTAPPPEEPLCFYN